MIQCISIKIGNYPYACIKTWCYNNPHLCHERGADYDGTIRLCKMPLEISDKICWKFRCVNDVRWPRHNLPNYRPLEDLLNSFFIVKQTTIKTPYCIIVFPLSTEKGPVMPKMLPRNGVVMESIFHLCRCRWFKDECTNDEQETQQRKKWICKSI